MGKLTGGRELANDILGKSGGGGSEWVHVWQKSGIPNVVTFVSMAVKHSILFSFLVLSDGCQRRNRISG